MTTDSACTAIARTSTMHEASFLRITLLLAIWDHEAKEKGWPMCYSSIVGYLIHYGA